MTIEYDNKLQLPLKQFEFKSKYVKLIKLMILEGMDPKIHNQLSTTLPILREYQIMNCHLIVNLLNS